MTRDEAIALMQGMNPECEDCEQAIDTFAALGMLGFDSGEMVPHGDGTIHKIRWFMRKFHLENFSPAQLQSALNSAGLKIVEAARQGE